ncbi:conserved protein of unknown function [Ectopseudomonas oleovorans]|uniref:Uncharacterized protein n=1 Tax=Ectopseudomonas oleovorans TaxID=301 RepID=A0A653B044_ECTOL|nr:conserved protein of unknown function [Pseudomonas oleovorans]
MVFEVKHKGFLAASLLKNGFINKGQ